jgi:hypothetical protein
MFKLYRAGAWQGKGPKPCWRLARSLYHSDREAKTYSTLDQEVITLAAVWDLIGSMVHYAHFEMEHRLDDTILISRRRRPASSS